MSLPARFSMHTTARRTSWLATALLLVLGLSAAPGLAEEARAQDPDFERTLMFESYAAFRDTLGSVLYSPARLSAFLDRLEAAGQIPYVQGSDALGGVVEDDTVLFLFRPASGSASRVEWNGDFNGWRGGSGWQGENLGGRGVWALEKTFPKNARLDYKIVVDGTDWILDPRNRLRMMSGFGPNSELRMPGYQYPRETLPQAGTPRGTLGPSRTLASSRLGYPVRYRVYTPPGYDPEGAPLRTLYVTDGHEYADDALGALPIVLDNLIGAGTLPPVLAVFVDPRDVATGQNRRQEQYVGDADFAAFVAETLVPAIDAAYATDAQREARAILGTSLGGLFSAYLAHRHPGTFGNALIQSPAFWAHPDVYAPYDVPPASWPDGAPRIAMSQGTIGDGNGGETLERQLAEHGYDYAYTTRNEGHSWGQWRGLLGEMLTFVWGADATDVEAPDANDDRGALPAGFGLRSVPNPARGAASVQFDLAQAQRVTLRVYDALGRRVAAPLTGDLRAEGAHSVPLDTSGWAGGLYLLRLDGDGSTRDAARHSETGTVLVVR